MFSWLISLKIKHYVKLLDKVFKYGLIVLVVLILILVGFVLQYDLPWVSSERVSVFGILDMVLKTVVIISLLLLTIQSCLSRKRTDNTYVISRSQKAIDLLAQWSLEIGRDALIARHIVENLPLEECRKLYNYECVKIRSEDYNSLCLLFPKRFQERLCERTKQNLEQSEEISTKCPYWEACEAKEWHLLNQEESLILRAYVLKYLNILEVIMAAWMLDVVDREIIEKEFEYLVTIHRNGKVVLENMRTVAGKESFPGISSFCEYVEQNTKNELKPKRITG